MYPSCEQRLKPCPDAVEVRLLTEFEVNRLESVIANEERCRDNGYVFSECDIEQEGSYILGVGKYRARYDADYVRYQTRSDFQTMTYTRTREMKTCLSHGFSVSYWYTKNSRQRVLQNGHVEVIRESARQIPF